MVSQYDQQAAHCTSVSAPSTAQNTRSQIVFKKDLHLQLAEEAL
jgi:hypothetical protein